MVFVRKVGIEPTMMQYLDADPKSTGSTKMAYLRKVYVPLLRFELRKLHDLNVATLPFAHRGVYVPMEGVGPSRLSTT